MATISLKATTRTDSGKGVARKIRREGRIPAVVYRGGDNATSVVIDPAEITLKFNRTGNRNTLVSLDLESGSRLCLVREVQRHPVSGNLRHIDFYEVDDNQFITVLVPVEAVGTAQGIKLGGQLQLMRRDLNVRCKPADIPSTISVEVSELDVGEFIRVSQVTAPENTELIYGGDFNVITVVGKRGPKVDEETEEAE
ncbi:MAG: 50S ribosomal protein L25 [Myxococcota bacterium]|nr:50S ribosomal protein L25 [Myxococcota bacterium]